MKTKPKAHKLTPKKEAKAFTGVHALLVFPSEEDRRATLDLTRRFSAALRYAYNRLLEGKPREELKRQDGPLCTLFRLNTRHADDATLKAQALLDSARERGEDPRKVVFGGRGRFEQLKRRHLSGKPLKRLKREWKERRQGLALLPGGQDQGGQPQPEAPRQGRGPAAPDRPRGRELRPGPPEDGPPQPERPGGAGVTPPFPTTWSSPSRRARSTPTITWTEEPAPLTITKENGVLALDVNSDPYHLALAVVTPDGNLKRHLALSLEEVDRAENRGAKELVLWKVAHRVVSLALEHGVAIATERLKYLRKTTRGDGTGRAFRRKEHRFAYASLLRKVHSLARKRGVQVVEVNPQDTSTMGMLKYAPQLSLSKDVAAAYVIGRRALGFKEKLPKGYQKLLRDGTLPGPRPGLLPPPGSEELRSSDRGPSATPTCKRRLSREIGRAKRHLSLLSSLQGSPGSRKGSTDGRNPSGANPWRVLKAGTFLPLLGRAVPRDLSPLKVVLNLASLTHRGAWEGWKGSLGPHPGGGPGCVNVHFG